MEVLVFIYQINAYFCVMDISADIELLNSMLPSIKHPSIHSSIKDLLASLKKNGVQERISIEQYNKEIELSDEEYDKGNYISNEEFIAETKKW